MKLAKIEIQNFIRQTASCKPELQISFMLNSLCQLLRGNECWKMAKTFIQLGRRTFNCGSELIWEVTEVLICVLRRLLNCLRRPFVLNHILLESKFPRTTTRPRPAWKIAASIIFWVNWGFQVNNFPHPRPEYGRNTLGISEVKQNWFVSFRKKFTRFLTLT